ncbi:MAG: T9SS type A sorting domain-containing protein [Flavobacteriales bacterium]|nr:T9SS type A sorting domain-containing protein [Flavobacteriales bacterium]MCC6937383.1 T9SS type A sorting domain-containing protein [Flavobacteriales bacterium]
MKSTPLLIALCVTLTSAKGVSAQASFQWEQRASLPASGRYGPFTFVIGAYGYVAGGGNASGTLTECWRYDPVADAWNQVASLPTPRRHGASFSVGGMGYVACGQATTSSWTTTLYAYDPISDSWATKASLPGTPRYGAHGFAINGFGYVGGGNSGSGTGPFLDDMWRYDPVSDTWTAATGIPGLARYGSTAFTLNGKGYVHGGRDASLDFTNELWEFDPIAETWTSKPPMPGLGRSWTMVMAFQYDAVIAGGKDVGLNVFYDAYRYHPASNTWNPIPDYPGASGWSGTSFGIGDRTFGGLGSHLLPSETYHNDLWELVKVDLNGVREPEERDGRLRISPNPSNGDHVRITATCCVPPSGVELQLINALGQQVLSVPFIESEPVDLSGVASGIYTLRLLADRTTFMSGRITVSR